MNAQGLYELIYFYQQQTDYSNVIKYTEEFFVDKQFTFDDVNTEKCHLGLDSVVVRDDFLKEYIYACAYEYHNTQYQEKVYWAYHELSDKVIGVSSCDQSIKVYYDKTGEIETCMKLYDKLFDSSDHIVLKRSIAEWKLYFLESNSLDKELIQKTRAIFEQYDELVRADMENSRNNGVSAEEYVSNIK